MKTHLCPTKVLIKTSHERLRKYIQRINVIHMFKKFLHKHICTEDMQQTNVSQAAIKRLYLHIQQKNIEETFRQDVCT